MLGLPCIAYVRLQITCDYGAVLRSSAVITCNTDGQWDTAPLCDSVCSESSCRSSSLSEYSCKTTVFGFMLTVFLRVLLQCCYSWYSILGSMPMARDLLADVSICL